MPDINQAITAARAQLGGPRGVRVNPTMIPPRLQAFAQKYGMQAAQDRFAKFRAGGLPGQQIKNQLTGGPTPAGPGAQVGAGGETYKVGGGAGGGNPMSGDGGGPSGGGFDYEGGPAMSQPYPAGPPSGPIFAGGPEPGYLAKPQPYPQSPGNQLTGFSDPLTGGGTRANPGVDLSQAGGETYGVAGGTGGGISTGSGGMGPGGVISESAPPAPGMQIRPPFGGGNTPPWAPQGGLGPPQIKGGPMRQPPRKGGTKMKVQSGLGAMNNGALAGFS